MGPDTQNNADTVTGSLNDQIKYEVDENGWFVIPMCPRGWKALEEESKKAYAKLTRMSAWS